jgi:hypothetical protein
MFGSMNQVDEEFTFIVDRAIANLPKNIVDWASVKVIFISSCENGSAFTLNWKEWKHISGFIFLCEELRKKPETTQTFTIAHEIAHRKLGHVSPVLSNLTDEQDAAQEQEADDLALKWLPEYKTEWDQSLRLRLEIKKQVAELNKRSQKNSFVKSKYFPFENSIPNFPPHIGHSIGDFFGYTLVHMSKENRSRFGIWGSA